MNRTLEELAPGESGMIKSVENDNVRVKRRLIDMGLTPGTKVTVKKIAPFGDPIEISLRGFALSLRKEDARRICILPPSEAPAPAEKSGKTSYFSRRYDQKTLERMRIDHEHEHAQHSGAYDASAHDRRKMKLALAGNPNSGKTSLFNALTGARQYVGNWPGVTVEKKEGKALVDGKEVTIVDLPGIYSLSPYSLEEIITRDYIIKESPDAIINIVDATNLERNMYLTIQLLELERPMVVALNFMDEVEKLGDFIDIKGLSQALGIPVVPITARTGENLDELLAVAHRQMHRGFTIEPDDLYDDFTHEIHHKIGEIIHDRAYAAGLPAHWSAVKLLEGDRVLEIALNLAPAEKTEVESVIAQYEASSAFGDRETLLADSRYKYIENVVASSVRHGKPRQPLSTSDRIDRVITHRIFAVPVFLLMMLVVFSIVFGPAGSFLSDAVAIFFDRFLTVWTASALASFNAAPWITGLVVDGVIAGVGGVLTFLPQIALLFFFLSILEDSGYMSRAAFIMDRLLRRFGLSGKAFIPMIMGFGCTVPAVMGARTMENQKDRRMTVMLVPFMSCSAKLPVYGLISAAFFGKNAGLVVFSLYVIGMLMAIVSGLLFKNTIFSGETAPFVLELPPYRMPMLKNTLRHVWEKVRGFLVKAGTVILVMSVILWFLQNFNSRFEIVESSSESLLGALGGFISPALRPLGFGTWQAAVALLTGLVAKEAVVASMSMFFGFSLTASNSAIAAALAGTFTPLSAFSFLLFVLLYIPCIAAVAAISREMHSLRYTAFSVFWQLFCAYMLSLAVFQLGTLLGF